jgi:hypothetical protein
MRGTHPPRFSLLVALILSAGGCSTDKQEPIAYLLPDGGLLSIGIAARMPPVLRQHWENQPKVHALKRGGKYQVWLTLREWQQGRSPWVRGESWSHAGGAPTVAQGMSVERERIEFGDDYRVGQVKIIWPRPLLQRVEPGQLGDLRVQGHQSAWEADGDRRDSVQLKLELELLNSSERAVQVSNRLFVTGNDRVLISRLQDPGAPVEDATGPFVSMASFHLATVGPGEKRRFTLVSGRVDRSAVERLLPVRIEHLAYGWRWDAPQFPWR